MPRQYIVVRRSGKWWVMFDGHRRGPYDNEEAAVEKGVALARLDKATGEEAEVSVDEPDDGVPTVFSTKE